MSHIWASRCFRSVDLSRAVLCSGVGRLLGSARGLWFSTRSEPVLSRAAVSFPPSLPRSFLPRIRNERRGESEVASRPPASFTLLAGSSLHSPPSYTFPRSLLARSLPRSLGVGGEKKKSSNSIQLETAARRSRRKEGRKEGRRAGWRAGWQCRITSP